MKKFVFYILALLCMPLVMAQEFGTGLILDDEAYAKIPAKPNNVSFFDDLADITRASLRDYVPVVRSQGGYGTCTGWASAYYGRTIVEAKQRGITNQEEINEIAFHPIFTYLNAASDENKVNCQKGAGMDQAMRSLRDDGSPYFKDYKAQFCDDNIPQSVVEKARVNTIQEYRRVITGGEDNLVRVENVKRAIHHGNPVVIGFALEKSFNVAKGVLVPDNLGPYGFHAMCVVGFDDEKYGGAFEIVNSWGTNWGNNGYIWVKYDDFTAFTKYALEIVPKPKPVEEVYQSLAGELRIQLRGGKEMKVARGDTKFKKSVLGWQDVVKETDTEDKTVGDYRTAEAYPKETKYQIYAKVDQPSYMYVMYADSDGDNGVLFPNPDNPEIVSSYFDNTEAELIIPGEDYYFRLNSDVASDYTIVLFSADELDIASINEKLDGLEGDLMDKLYVLFNDELIDKSAIEMAADKMKFNAKFKEGSVAMMVLDIKRS